MTRTTCGIVEVGFVEGPCAGLLQFLTDSHHFFTQFFKLLLLSLNLFFCKCCHNFFVFGLIIEFRGQRYEKTINTNVPMLQFFVPILQKDESNVKLVIENMQDMQEDISWLLL